MTETAVKTNPLRDSLHASGFIYGAEVVTTRGYPKPDETLPAVKLAETLAADPRISWISVTDNPGGAPMLPPDWLAGKLADKDCPLVLHLACKDYNRTGLESAAWRYAAEGCDSILALTGDIPTTGFGGLTQTVFDLDSVGLVTLLQAMNDGMIVQGPRGRMETLPQTNFFIGCAASPFKRYERELIPQYMKMLLKIRAGARWILPQLGYDMRKFHELKLLLDSLGTDSPAIKARKGARKGVRHLLPERPEGCFAQKVPDPFSLAAPSNIPIIGNVYLLTKGVAKVFNSGRLAGCVVTDELVAVAEKQAASPDKGRSFFREFAAKQLAVFKGLGFAAGYIGGISKPDTFFEIIDKAESFGEDDWRDFLPEICYSQPDEFFLFDHDEKTGLATPDQLTPEYASAKKRGRSPVMYKISRKVHGLAFKRDKGLYGIAKKLYSRWDKKPKPTLASRFMYLCERLSKETLYGCHDCGDCSLPDIAYLCPLESCAKNQRNGPCGGSASGRCETDDKDCIWARAYSRLQAYGETDSLLEEDVVIQDPGLESTSSWANLYLDRDHHKPKNEDESEKKE